MDSKPNKKPTITIINHRMQYWCARKFDQHIV